MSAGPKAGSAQGKDTRSKTKQEPLTTKYKLLQRRRFRELVWLTFFFHHFFLCEGDAAAS